MARANIITCPASTGKRSTAMRILQECVRRGVEDHAFLRPLSNVTKNAMRTRTLREPTDERAGKVMDAHGRLPVDATTPTDVCVARTEEWVEEHVPVAWRGAAARGGPAARGQVR